MAEEDVDGGVAWTVEVRLGLAAELAEGKAHGLLDHARTVDDAEAADDGGVVLEAHARR